MKQKEPLKGKSYLLRCKKINEIYDKWVKIGLSNREIYRRFIYPEMGISERTFYKALKVDVPTTSQDGITESFLMPLWGI